MGTCIKLWVKSGFWLGHPRTFTELSRRNSYVSLVLCVLFLIVIYISVLYPIFLVPATDAATIMCTCPWRVMSLVFSKSDALINTCQGLVLSVHIVFLNTIREWFRWFLHLKQLDYWMLWSSHLAISNSFQSTLFSWFLMIKCHLIFDAKKKI